MVFDDAAATRMVPSQLYRERIATRRQEKRTIRLVASALDRDLSLPDTQHVFPSVASLSSAKAAVAFASNTSYF